LNLEAFCGKVKEVFFMFLCHYSYSYAQKSIWTFLIFCTKYADFNDENPPFFVNISGTGLKKAIKT